MVNIRIIRVIVYILGNLEMNRILTDLIESNRNEIDLEVQEAKTLYSTNSACNHIVNDCYCQTCKVRKAASW